MHEFSLYSQIPATRHGQVLHILAGVTASQPTSTLEQTLIYQQARLTETGTSKKASAGRQNAVPASRLSYHKLVRDLKGSDGEKGPWTFRAEDVPLPGMPNFVSRATTEHVLGEAELENFRQGNGWHKYAVVPSSIHLHIANSISDTSTSTSHHQATALFITTSSSVSVASSPYQRGQERWSHSTHQSPCSPIASP